MKRTSFTRAVLDDHPLKAVFETRRMYETARMQLNRALAGWAGGKLPHAEILPVLREAREAHAAFMAAIDASSHAVVQPGVRLGTRLERELGAFARAQTPSPR